MAWSPSSPKSGLPMKIYKNPYYRAAELVVPPDLKHRQIKLKLENGKWVSFSVCSVEELRKKLVEHLPEAAFISVSCFLNPDHIQKKWSGNITNPDPHTWNDILNNLILTSDFVIDFDEGDTFLELQKAYHYLKGICGFKDFMIVQTKRGYHLWVTDFYKKRCRKIANPKDREAHIEAQKRCLANELKKNLVNFDYPISVDCRRIVRLPNSLYDDGSLICRAYKSLDDIHG